MAIILVTGGAGFIGSSTVERLLMEGHRVAVLDNLSTGRRENLAQAEMCENFEFHVGDVTAPGEVDRLVSVIQPDAIIHLAALVSVQESIRRSGFNFALNVQAVHEVAEAVRRYGVRRVVFASSAAVYGNGGNLPLAEAGEPWPISPYGAAKLAGEALLLGHAASFGFSALCLRYFNVVGVRQRADSPYSGVLSIFAERSRLGLPVTIFGDGRQTRDFVHVNDVARANVLAATVPDKTSDRLNVCSGREVSLLEIWATMRSVLPGLPEPEFRPAREGDILRSVGDPARARSRLGFESKTDVKESIDALIGPKSTP